MAAKGLLITDDWAGREELGFKDGEHLVLFKDISDLKEKIKHYLENKEKRSIIRENGYKIVQQYSRKNWAKKIVEKYNDRI